MMGYLYESFTKFNLKRSPKLLKYFLINAEFQFNRSSMRLVFGESFSVDAANTISVDQVDALL
jgi:hypothetical protein